MSKRIYRNSWPYVLLLAFFAIAIFWKLIFTHDYSILTYTDSAFQTYPWSQFIARTLHQGSFPFWDNYSNAGRSFIGEAQTGAFYPLNLVQGSLKLNSKGLRSTQLIENFIIFHCFLGSLFMFLLCRHLKLSPFSSFVAAVIFCYSGSIGMRAAAQVNLLNSSIWLPAIFLCYLKCLEEKSLSRQILYANLAGLCLAMSFLAGHHQPPLYMATAMICFALILCVSKGTRTAVFPALSPGMLARQTSLVFVFAFAYASLQILPSIEYSQLAYRWIDDNTSALADAKIPYEYVSRNHAMSPDKLVLLFFPYFSAVENSPYLGVVTLFLIMVALTQLRKNPLFRTFLWVGLFFFALSLGSASPLHGLSYVLLPGFDKGREASRIFIITHFTLSLVAALGCEAFFQPILRRERLKQALALKIFLALSGVLCLTCFIFVLYRGMVLQIYAGFSVPAFACLLFLASSLIIAARYYGLADLKTARIFLVLLLLFDFHFLIGQHIKLKNAYDGKENLEPEKYYSHDEVIRFLSRQPGVFRIDFADGFMPGCPNLVHQLESVDSYGATQVKSFHDFLDFNHHPDGKIADLLNVKYIATTQELSLPKLFQSGKEKVYENIGCMPRAWTVPEVVKHDRTEIPSRLAAESFNPHQQALLETDTPFPVIGRLPTLRQRESPGTP
ncbi:MAG: hypothetical protein U0V70_14090 [Terriglobia bacterium]